jgi:phage terminase small subunit
MPSSDTKPHIIYGKLTNEDLTSLIRVTAEGREKNSAGYDLIEMRRERERRQDVRLARTARKNYNKDQMLERAEKAPNFKPGNFIAGMSPKQEKFCMEYIATGDSLTAYKASGYAPGKNHSDTRRRAGTLLKNPKIEQRINDLREVALDRMAWSADHVLQRLDEVYQHALSNGDYTNANRSVENVAKHLGMFVERTEQKIKMGALGSGTDEQEDVQKDIERLANIAGLQVIEGGKGKVSSGEQ